MTTSATQVATGAATVAILDAAGHPDGQTLLRLELDAVADWCGHDLDRWAQVTNDLVALAGTAAWGASASIRGRYPRTAIAATILACAATTEAVRWRSDSLSPSPKPESLMSRLRRLRGGLRSC